VGGYVLAGQASRWVEPLSEADASAASVILFQRKFPVPDIVPARR